MLGLVGSAYSPSVSLYIARHCYWVPPENRINADKFMRTKIYVFFMRVYAKLPPENNTKVMHVYVFINAHKGEKERTHRS